MSPYIFNFPSPFNLSFIESTKSMKGLAFSSLSDRNLNYQFSFELTECISSGHNVIAGTSWRKHRSFTETGLLRACNLHMQRGSHDVFGVDLYKNMFGTISLLRWSHLVTLTPALSSNEGYPFGLFDTIFNFDTNINFVCCRSKYGHNTFSYEINAKF